METEKELKIGASQIVIYQNEENNISLNVRLEDENVWLTQQQMAELFQSSRTNIVEHIKHIYEEGELDERATCRKFRQVQTEGNRNVEQPYLEAIKNVEKKVNRNTIKN